MFPFQSSAQRRPPFAPLGPGATPFPTFTAPMGPSDSLALFGLTGHGRLRLQSSLKRSYLSDGLILCIGARASRPAARAPSASSASEVDHRASVTPDLTQERQGSHRLPGRPLRACAWSNTPPVPLRLAILASEDSAFRFADTLSTGMFSFPGLHSQGPLARLPTLQPHRYRCNCKAGYRPAG